MDKEKKKKQVKAYTNKSTYLPTKYGYEEFVFRPFNPDLSWVGINNKTKEV